MTITPERPGAVVELALDLRTPTTATHLDDGLPALVDRIHADHPEVDRLRVSSLLTEAHAVTEHAPVQNFRLVLAERSVRERLRRERRAGGPDPTAPDTR
jgi:hypothetical protein